MNPDTEKQVIETKKALDILDRACTRNELAFEAANKALIDRFNIDVATAEQEIEKNKAEIERLDKELQADFERIKTEFVDLLLLAKEK
jgi:hypothetical protein